MITKQKKQEIIEKIREHFGRAKSFIIVNLENLDVEKERGIRRLLKEKNCLFEVAKKTLILKAAPAFPFVDEELKKPFALLWDFTDGLNVFKSLLHLKKAEVELNILGGFYEGTKLSEDDVWEIAKLPPREELIQKLAYVINIPQKLVSNLLFPLQKLTFTLSAIKK